VEAPAAEAPVEAAAPTETPVPVEVDAPVPGDDGGVEAPNEEGRIAPMAGTTPVPVDEAEFPAVIEPPVDESASEEPAPVERDDSAIAPAAVTGALTFDAYSWDGGVLVDDGWYGRPAVAIYGQESGVSRAALTVELAEVPAGGIEVMLTGLGDEWGTAFPFAVQVNGVEVARYAGAFPNWNAAEHGERAETAVWGTATVEVPAALLRTGANEIAVVGEASGATVGQPPYLLLAEAAVSFSGGSAVQLAAKAPAEDGGRDRGRGDEGGGDEGDDGEGRRDGRRDRRDRDEEG
jgi:hypothetical protein